MSHLTLAINKDRRAYSILGEAATVEAAAKFGESAKSFDFRVIPRESLEEYSNPELTLIFNSLSPKEDHVDRFSSKPIGAKRVLGAWDKIATLAQDDGSKTVPFTPGARVPKPRVNGEGTPLRVHVLKEGKRFQKESLRCKAFDWLKSRANTLTVEEVLTQLSAEMKLTRGQVRGLLNKLAEVDMIAVRP